MTWIVDFDDQCDAWDALPYLLILKEKFPKFKVTLFTIPAESSYPHLLKLKQYDWIQLALHGWTHRINDEHNPTEMQHWSYDKSDKYLAFMSVFYGNIFVKGLKAPGWVLNEYIYQSALERGYWIMDRSYNDYRRLKGLNHFLLDRADVLHGHTWSCNGGVDNFIGDMIERGDFDKVTQEDDFKFVSEMVTSWQQ